MEMRQSATMIMTIPITTWLTATAKMNRCTCAEQQAGLQAQGRRSASKSWTDGSRPTAPISCPPAAAQPHPAAASRAAPHRCLARPTQLTAIHIYLVQRIQGHQRGLALCTRAKLKLHC